MNIEPPGTLEWLLLTLVGAMAGAVNALRGYARRGKTERLIVGAVEGATALFVTIVTYLMLLFFVPLALALLQSRFPELDGVKVPSLGLIGMAGTIAHLGLRQTIRMVLRMQDRTTGR